MLDLDTIFDPDRMPGAPASASTAVMPRDLPVDCHFLWDERAAIMEYDGGLAREHAEAQALKYILEDMQKAGLVLQPCLREVEVSSRVSAWRNGV
jgi:hypothetical protein